MHRRAEEAHRNDEQQRDDENDPGQAAWLFHGIDGPLDESPSLRIGVSAWRRGASRGRVVSS
ncbi:hypothetical protein [Dyella lutea]|uniref:Uncharacterized protein n=1 Tax=Dyella lutea TaxID=2950441 RepID=A0ABT1F7Y4_9GAMM|nr:hypothetical protein [Dyella lutea]MCP1373481.1 hypothetical protein [Dyella lutea]